MLRALAVLLLILNVAVFVWGWSQDGPLDPPLPPLPQAPGEILLGSEWAGRSAEVGARRESTSPAAAPSFDPLEGPPPTIPTEELRPSLLPGESEPGTPVVVPPVRVDEPGTTHTWSR
jgi:hypothetical protein